LAASIAVRVSRLGDVNDRRLWAVMAIVVLAVWLGGAAVTKYSLEQMAFVTPVAVVVVGVTVGLVLLWVKVVADSIRRRGGN
jgi:protein-S-isoprenylcysteine O-methyltransferase Ste14